MSKDIHRGADEESVVRFVRSAFRSVWSVELLMLLRSQPDQGWTRDRMIESLRASEQVLTRSIEDLRAAGLIRFDKGLVQYGPEAPVMDETVVAVVRLYTVRPAMVRRLIAGGSDDQLARFAEAFRFRGENK